MAKKTIWMGMLAMALAFGMAVVGCDDGTDDDSDPLNGTWATILDIGNGRQQEIVMRLDNGSFENSMIQTGYDTNYNGPHSRGTYTASGGTFNSTVTHYHGNYVNAVYPGSQAGSGWITMEQFYSVMEYFYRQSGMSEDMINFQMNALRASTPSTTASTYSINGNTLTINTTAYTRR